MLFLCKVSHSRLAVVGGRGPGGLRSQTRIYNFQVQVTVELIASAKRLPYSHLDTGVAGVNPPTRRSHRACLFRHGGAHLHHHRAHLHHHRDHHHHHQHLILINQNMLLVAGGFSSSSECARCVCQPSESSRQGFLIVICRLS